RLIPHPHVIVGRAQVNAVVESIGVAVVADVEIDAVAAGGEPAGAGAAGAIAPQLAVQTDAEDLIVAADDLGEIAGRVGPGGLRPEPDAVVGAAEENEIVGGVAVADGGDGDVGAVAGRGLPTG